MGSLPNRVPLVIGTTGHRDLRAQDVPLLEREVSAIIARLRKDYLGGDDESPIILVSALAEGADRVVARAALASGVKLIAPLPLPVDEYRRDFEPGLAPNAVAEFDQLLSEASAAPVMSFTAGNSLEAVRADPDKRAEQYRAVGLFIVQHCDVLIALWDGNQSDMAAGGTGEVVTFKREGIPLSVSRSAHASLDGSEIGPVIHIVTPRLKAGSPATAVTVSDWGEEIIHRHRGNRFWQALAQFRKFGDNLVGRDPNARLSSLPAATRRALEAWETFGALIALTHEFNGEAAALEASATGPLQKTGSIDGLFVDPGDGHLDDDAKLRALKVAPHWCEFFGIADTLAINRQKQFRYDWIVLFCLGFGAFLFFTLSGHLASAFKFLLDCYSVLVLVVFVLVVRARIRRDQERFLDYRALAEAFRVAVYWRLLGIDSGGPDGQFATSSDSIGTVANFYPIKQPSELAWIKICLRTIDLWRRTQESPPKSEMDSQAHAIVRRFWVYGQLSYFDRQGARHTRRAEFLESWSLVILGITMVFLMLLVFGFVDDLHLGLIDVHKGFLIATGILPGLAAALTGYSERMALAAQARQYERMGALFRRAYELLPETLGKNTEQQVRSLYCELGIEAVKESADWVAIYRQRPLQPVQGG
jgi:hypothetical protein